MDHLRQLLRHRRRQINGEQQRIHADKICQRIYSSEVYKKATHIACYLSNDGEVNLKPLMRQAEQDKKIIYLPCLTKKTPTLSFLPYQENITALVDGLYGILQPKAGEPVTLDTLELVCVPTVGFTHDGWRLGRGGGYYDKTFAKANKKTTLIGVAHQFQRMRNYKPNEWDIRMHAIVTEQAWLNCT